MKLSYKKTVLVGFAFFLICAFWQAYDSIIPKILTDKFGLTQSMSGLIMGLDNILALFMLPLFGAISDRTKTRYGKRTPYIFIGTVLAVVFFLLLGVSDLVQLKQLDEITMDNPTALQTLYDADLTVTTPDGETVEISKEFTKTEFTEIEKGSEDYAKYVTPARQMFARQKTLDNPKPFIFFMAILLLLLISMAIFRSPAVALMPDVTLKPLRSKANAIINLMGSVGGILVLVLGIVFGTGKLDNSLMSYLLFFACIALIMTAALVVFALTVREPKWSEEMLTESAQLGIETTDDKPENGDRKLQKGERTSLLLLLLSVILWFMGYNAVTSKYSVYAGSVLNLDFNMTLIIAQAAAIISYLPVGFIASKVGRKSCILFGIIIMGLSFFAASFLRMGTSMWVMTIFFALAGIGWATINVNSFPMVVELATGSNVGRYTGFYYTASMFAQTVTPYFSGLIMDRWGMRTLFPYGAIFVLLALLSMQGVRHGDNRPTAKQVVLDAFEVED
ncbi:MAG: MFS transporter [Oscillospiraceae bacterium]|nr:MFS transporter [Oscillospiraceae bacterium]